MQPAPVRTRERCAGAALVAYGLLILSSSGWRRLCCTQIPPRTVNDKLIKSYIGFDPEDLNLREEMWALRMSRGHAMLLRQRPDMKPFTYRAPRHAKGVHSMIHLPHCDKVLLLLCQGLDPHDLPAHVQNAVDEHGCELVRHVQNRGYADVSYKEALRYLLPEEIRVPTGYEVVGSLAHFNLREEHWPYRHLIGRVFLDKNPSLSTVVAKLGILSGAYRTFDMEVIAGCDNTNITIKEFGLVLKFDFRKVYWNSRLSEERHRVLRQVSSDDVVCDLFAGIGALALMCARKGCRVLANDWNPAASQAAKQNAAANKLPLEVHSMDARKFARRLENEPRLEHVGTTPKVHIVLNLPEKAPEFLDVFETMLRTGYSRLFSGSALELCVHCYCFAHSVEQAHGHLHKVLADATPQDITVRAVRDVAPGKKMYCLEFRAKLASASN